MSDKTLYILRGCSNSGKTTLAKTLEGRIPFSIAVSADDYFYDKAGNYNWEVEDLGKAHRWCKNEVEAFMGGGTAVNIILHNTNTSEKEITPYINLAEKYGYKVVSLVVEKRHDNHNNHSVPEETLIRQKNRLTNSIKLL